MTKSPVFLTPAQLKSSRNKKVLNDVTAALFSVSFSQLPAAKKKKKKRKKRKKKNGQQTTDNGVATLLYEMPSNLKGKTSSQKSHGIALRIQWHFFHQN